MKTQTVRRGYAALVGFSLMTAVLVIGARGQAPDNPGGFGGPGNGGPGGNNGRGFPDRPQFAFGTVISVDASAGTITMTSTSGGNTGGSSSQVIKINSGVQLVTQSEVRVADLKVGDQVQVQGVPTGITVSQFTIGTPPIGLPGAGGFGPGGSRGGNGGGGSTTGGGGSTTAGSTPLAAPTPSFATAGGTIKALPTKADPHLAISLSADTQLFLKIAEGAKITRYTPLKIADIKNGDRIMADGQTGADGTLVVSVVGVNLAMRGGGGGPAQ